MTTAGQYNEAVRDLAAAQKRNQELETRHMGQVMRIEGLMEAVETANHAGVLKNRELQARNAELEKEHGYTHRQIAEVEAMLFKLEIRIVKLEALAKAALEMRRAFRLGHRSWMVQTVVAFVNALDSLAAAEEEDAK